MINLPPMLNALGTSPHYFELSKMRFFATTERHKALFASRLEHDSDSAGKFRELSRW
jgi:hypothetical protein